MNKHIEVVKKWIAGEEVSVEALQANADAAWAAAEGCAADADAADAAYAAAYAAYADADHWVKRYEELST